MRQPREYTETQGSTQTGDAPSHTNHFKEVFIMKRTNITTNTIKEVAAMNTTKRIGLHTMHAFNQEVMISTVQLGPELFETMVLFHDGDELECHRTTTLKAAKAKHNEVMRRWNDRLYEGSIAQHIGYPNIGQFVHPVVTC